MKPIRILFVCHGSIERRFYCCVDEKPHFKPSERPEGFRPSGEELFDIGYSRFLQKCGAPALAKKE